MVEFWVLGLMGFRVSGVWGSWFLESSGFSGVEGSRVLGEL